MFKLPFSKALAKLTFYVGDIFALSRFLGLAVPQVRPCRGALMYSAALVVVSVWGALIVAALAKAWDCTTPPQTLLALMRKPEPSAYSA
ncbi:hypothetical protein [Pediococcus acidilactici]|uniref:hypothetical protein n=1 Tax=Pediococcus acidilactici TaxID=1254 RepID=UPI0035676A41